MNKLIALLLCSAIFYGCAAENNNVPQEISMDAPLAGEITVSAFHAMPYKSFLETAAAMFEEKFPGTKINVDVHSAMPEVKTMEIEDGLSVAMIERTSDSESGVTDYISRITTELMSGGGPDLMAADVLPYYKYAMGGQLEELKLFMDADTEFDRAEYRSNLLDALEINGGLYVMPLDYSFQLIAYDPSLFTDEALEALRNKNAITFDEMVELAKTGFTDTNESLMFSVMGGGMGGSMIYNMLDADYRRFVDVPNKNADFGEGFIGLLETAKGYEESGYISPGSMRTVDMDTARLIDHSQPTYYKIVGNGFQLMNYYSNYYSEAKTGEMRNMVVMNGSTLMDTDEIGGLLSNASGEVPFEFSQGYAINSNSANKELAWAFLKYLASEEVQTSGAAFMGGIPINNKAANAKAKLDASGVGQRASFAGASTGLRTSSRSEGEPMQRRPEGEGTPDGEQIQRRPEGEQIQRRPEAEGAEQIQRRPEAEVMEGVTGEAISAADVDLTPEQQKVYDAYTNLIDECSARLNTFYIKDPIVTEAISSEIPNFFNGDKTAAEVAQAIQNKVGLYLSE